MSDLIVNDYKSVKIGDQEWMVENLKTNHFRNGDLIPELKSDKQINGKAAWCNYDSDSQKGERFGKLYNWYAVNDKRGLAPKGWHIPSKEEFQLLIKNVKNDSNSLKALNQGSGNGMGTNSIGFEALLAGYRGHDNCFFYLNEYAYFWSSTEVATTYANYLFLNPNNSNICSLDFGKEFCFSVRCLKD